MQKKKNCFYNFFSSSGKKALPQPYPENAPFLSNPDTGGVNSSSRLQRIPTSSYRVPMASTATEENAKVDLDGLITHISKLFEFKEGKISYCEPKAAKQYWPNSQSFINLRTLLYEGINYSSNISVNSKTIVSSILQGMGSTNNIVAVGFLVVANILERIDDVRANRIECLSLLKEMAKLAKVVKDFKERAHLSEKMNDEIKDATTLIVEGSLMCCTQIDSSKFSRFFNTSVNKEELVKLKKELDTVYRDLQNKMGFFIFENSEKIREKINVLSSQKEVLDQRRAYHEHPGHVPPPPGAIIIYAQTVNLQTGALPSSTGYPEYPSQLPYISEYADGFPAPAQVPRTRSRSIMAPGRSTSNVETTWQQAQAQGVQQREPRSAAKRNDPEENDQGWQPTRTVQTKEQHKSFAEKKGAIERREEQPLRKAEEYKQKEQERKSKEAEERKERDAEEKKTKAKAGKSKTAEVERARESETQKTPTAVQPQKSQNPEESQRKKDKPEEHARQERSGPGLKREPLNYRVVN